MFRVVITVLLHGSVFFWLWWQQLQDTVAQPDDLASGVSHWQQNMSPTMWVLWAVMLLAPALALLSCKRQSLRARGLLCINWLFAFAIIYAAHTEAQYMHYQIWVWWLVFSLVMLGIALLNGLSARIGRVPQPIGKNKK